MIARAVAEGVGLEMGESAQHIHLAAFLLLQV